LNGSVSVSVQVPAQLTWPAAEQSQLPKLQT
jgi:hypothetical protein